MRSNTASAEIVALYSIYCSDEHHNAQSAGGDVKMHKLILADIMKLAELPCVYVDKYELADLLFIFGPDDKLKDFDNVYVQLLQYSRKNMKISQSHILGENNKLAILVYHDDTILSDQKCQIDAIRDYLKAIIDEKRTEYIDYLIE